VIIDGLVTSAVAPLLGDSAPRHRLVLLVHLPQGSPEERAVAGAASAIIATSPWAGRWMARAYTLPTQHVHVVEPGVDPADVVRGSEAGDRLLCVAALSPLKGQDVLVDALALLPERRWRCTLVGSGTVDREFTALVEQSVRSNGIDDRTAFTGPLGGSALSDAYGRADLLIVPSRTETYGMVVTEALARGIPVICSRTGGLPETLGTDGNRERPGLLVPAGDPRSLADAIESWLDDPALRAGLRARARGRRASLTGWDRASDQMSRVLHQVAA
jgi:glycosyltransferase involved in cell wall biosynthesis